MTKESTKATSSVLKILSVLVVICMVFLIAREIEKSAYPRDYQDIVTAASEEFGVPEAYIFSVIYVESHFNARAVSSAGAAGLMQLKPSTFLEVCGKIGVPMDEDLIFEPAHNIRCGTFYLAYLYGIFGNWDTVLAAYNAGLGNVSAWLKDERYTDGRGNLTAIPFPETESYLKKVNRAFAVYNS